MEYLSTQLMRQEIASYQNQCKRHYQKKQNKTTNFRLISFLKIDEKSLYLTIYNEDTITETFNSVFQLG